MKRSTAQKLSELVVSTLVRSSQLFVTQGATGRPTLLPQDAADVHNVMSAWPTLVQTLTIKCGAAGSSKGFFDSSVGSQFANRSESPRKSAPKQAAPTTSASGKLLACCFTTKRQSSVHADA